MYGKKIIMAVAMVSVVTLSASMFAAFEAHVVNVTAHIENALAVDTEAIEFGTVFPQEYLEKPLEIRLSDSFVEAFNSEEQRVQFVDYKIVSKPKCWNDDSENPEYAPVDFATHECPTIDGVQYVVMKDLCKFLSKMPAEETGGYNKADVGVPSYYTSVNGYTSVSEDDKCEIVDPPYVDDIDWATGSLAACQKDLVDNWTIDLKVPPFVNHIGQDWPESCKNWVLEEEENKFDYGCDLWIEVTGIYNVNP
ncbi:MAG: hypothetical protein U9N04_03405 [Patescibacteria group bacterium]|nr:hypothetical protein [Patescibacteria group bacterium]